MRIKEKFDKSRRPYSFEINQLAKEDMKFNKNTININKIDIVPKIDLEELWVVPKTKEYTKQYLFIK